MTCNALDGCTGASHANRRVFLRNCGVFAAGAAAGFTMPAWLQDQQALSAEETSAGGGAEARLKQLGIELPPAPAPVATYVPAVLVGELLYVAGHGPGEKDGRKIVGKVGRDLDLDAGKEAARYAGYRILSTVRSAVGSLDKVRRLVKTLGLVNATDDFTEQPQVVNGFSDLMVEVFGARAGKGARSAVGVASLPGGIPVEIEAVFQIG